MWTKHMDDVFKILSRVALAGLLTTVLAMPANAGDREQARRIHDRLAGVPPTADEVSVANGKRNVANGANRAWAILLQWSGVSGPSVPPISQWRDTEFLQRYVEELRRSLDESRPLGICTI